MLNLKSRIDMNPEEVATIAGISYTVITPASGIPQGEEPSVYFNWSGSKDDRLINKN